MKKTLIILTLFALIASSCRQATNKQAETANEVAVEEVQEIVVKTTKNEHQDLINAIRKSILTEFADFELSDLLSINNEIYLLLIKPSQHNGIILACKYKDGVVTFIEHNENFLDLEDGGNHWLEEESNSTFFLYSDYGQSAQSGDLAYFTVKPEGVFVDSLVLFRKIYADEEVYLECATLTQKNFGKLRLKYLTNHIWDNYEIIFKRQE